MDSFAVVYLLMGGLRSKSQFNLFGGRWLSYELCESNIPYLGR